MGSLPKTLVERLRGLLEAVQELTHQIQSYDHQLEKTARGYRDVARLTSIPCVGTLTALSFVLTLEDPGRIARSRLAGCVCGLRPRRSQSGESDPQRGIAKTGDGYLRTLLVQCAHHLLGHFGKDCAPRRWGLSLAERGGSRAKKRAIIAVARKLAVLLHRIWTTQQTFVPFPSGLPADQATAERTPAIL